MTAVRSIDGFRYGARLSAYVFLTVAVGGGGVALGAAVGYEHALAAVDGGGYDVAELVGGGLLLLFGAFLALSGLFGLLYKLLADGIAAGATAFSEEFSPLEVAGIEPDESRAEDGTNSPEPTRSEPIGPSPGEQAAREYGAAQLVSPSPSAIDGEQHTETAPPPSDQSDETDETPADGVAAADEKAPEQPDERAPRAEDEQASSGREETPEKSDDTQSRPAPSPEEIAFGTTADDSDERTDTESPDDTENSESDPLVDPTGEE